MEATLTKTATTTGFSRQGVEELSRLKNEPDWLRQQRLAAWDVYESLPMPQRTDEEWRRTDIRRLKLDNLKPFIANASKAADPATALAGFEDGGVSNRSARAGVAIQRDSINLHAEFDPALAAQGVIFTSLETAALQYPELFQQYFMTQAVPVGFGKFEALHAACWQGGALLYVPKNVTVELPFRSFAVATEPGAALFTHSLVILEEGAEAFFVDAFHSETGESQSLSSAVVELILHKRSKLRYVQVQDWGRHCWNFMTQRAVVENDATLNSLDVTLGSQFSKNSITSVMRGENSLAEMLGIYFGESDQFFDHHTWQIHEAAHATSDLEFKGALKGDARSVYSGLIKVEEGAQKTDAYQQNRNLLLSRNARADSIPNLEIAANDVRCTHGATVSQVTPEHVFYLQSRGIPYTEAQKLIVEGFFRPVIDRIPVEDIQGFLESAIARKVGI